MTKALCNGRESFSLIAPSILLSTRYKIVNRLYYAYRNISTLKRIILDKESLANIAGEYLAGRLIYAGAEKILPQLYKSIPLNEHHLLKPQRSWFNKKGKGKFVVVYHHANKAGKHIDIHFDNGTSFIMRVDNKPVEKLIKFNSKGLITEESRKALLEHIRSEIRNSSRVPQNLDHSLLEARMSWALDKGPKEGYGSGPTRQVILEDKYVIFKLSKEKGQTAELFIPSIDPYYPLYIHKLYPGDDKKVPIVIWGQMKPKHPEFKDRLHLTLIDPKNEEKFKNITSSKSISRKYDGASCYIHVGKDRTTVWSPRISKKTGDRIEYTMKVWELADIQNDNSPVAMGELLFKKKILGFIPGPYLTAAEIGGILNSNSLRPNNIIPEIRLYRADRWNGKDIGNLEFFDNRKYQKAISELHPFLNLVELTGFVKDLSWEGLVGIPKGMSVNDGYKIKWWQDADDWQITDVNLKLSDKGNPSGVVWFKSLKSDKEFKLGPGQIGSFDQNMEIIEHPELFIGKVAKVSSRNGHEGRAAKLIEWHLDKGN